MLKAKASTYSHRKSASRVDQKVSSNRVPGHRGGTYNGKRISNYRPSRVTATALGDGKHIEVAFWEKKPLQGRQITLADVFTAYGNDRTSLRQGFFLQKLCLQNVLYNKRDIFYSRLATMASVLTISSFDKP